MQALNGLGYALGLIPGILAIVGNLRGGIVSVKHALVVKKRSPHDRRCGRQGGSGTLRRIQGGQPRRAVIVKSAGLLTACYHGVVRG